MTATPPSFAHLALPYEEAERMHRVGTLSYAHWRLYLLLWTWSAPRFGGEAGMAQDRCYRRIGEAGLERRQARALAWTQRLKSRGAENTKHRPGADV